MEANVETATTRAVRAESAARTPSCTWRRAFWAWRREIPDSAAMDRAAAFLARTQQESGDWS